MQFTKWTQHHFPECNTKKTHRYNLPRGVSKARTTNHKSRTTNRASQRIISILWGFELLFFISHRNLVSRQCPHDPIKGVYIYIWRAAVMDVFIVNWILLRNKWFFRHYYSSIYIQLYHVISMIYLAHSFSINRGHPLINSSRFWKEGLRAVDVPCIATPSIGLSSPSVLLLSDENRGYLLRFTQS